jgi:hypothetical protein
MPRLIDAYAGDKSSSCTGHSFHRYCHEFVKLVSEGAEARPLQYIVDQDKSPNYENAKHANNSVVVDSSYQPVEYAHDSRNDRKRRNDDPPYSCNYGSEEPFDVEPSSDEGKSGVDQIFDEPIEPIVHGSLLWETQRLKMGALTPDLWKPIS